MARWCAALRATKWRPFAPLSRSGTHRYTHTLRRVWISSQCRWMNLYLDKTVLHFQLRSGQPQQYSLTHTHSHYFLRLNSHLTRGCCSEQQICRGGRAKSHLEWGYESELYISAVRLPLIPAFWMLNLKVNSQCAYMWGNCNLHYHWTSFLLHQCRDQVNKVQTASRSRLDRWETRGQCETCKRRRLSRW